MTQKKVKHTHTKRFGYHHKKTKKYHSTYWPYLPVLMMLLMLFVWGLFRSPANVGVLAFATEISAEKLLLQTNKERQSSGVGSLVLNDKLRAAAQAKAEDMARHNYWSHVSPDGTEPWAFIDETDYAYSKAGENLAYGFLTSTQTVKGWMNSPTHRENMLDEEFREVGFGYVNATGFQDSSEETIVVALYARPLSADVTSVSSSASAASFTMTVPEASTYPSETLAVTRLATLTGAQFTWATFLLGVISGAAVLGIVATHTQRIRSLWHRGEEFVLHHPMLDFSLLSIVAVAIFMASHVGYIA